MRSVAPRLVVAAFVPPPTPSPEPIPRSSARGPLAGALVALAVLVPIQALAEDPPARTTATPSPTTTGTTAPLTPTAPGAAAPAAPAPGASPETPIGKLSLAAYVEALYSYNFNRPSNGITNYRGFDDRHDTFTISNAVLDATWEKGFVSGRVALQVGQTPSTYYLAEPTQPGTAVAGPSDPSTWRILQQAYVSARAPVGLRLSFDLGLFLSPVGIESMAVKDDWNWSRSNLFFALPSYHAGFRAKQQLTREIAVVAAIYDGWNQVVDENREKSISAQLTYTDPDRLLVSVLYLGGVERPEGAREGRAWRHLFDAWAEVKPLPRLGLAACGDAGFEPNAFGISWWAAGAGYVDVEVARWLHLAARGDYFYEHAASSAIGTAARIFWPGNWVASATATVRWLPLDQLAVYGEYRHDQAAVDTYFAGTVEGDGSPASPFLPNAKAQNTITLGATAWF